MSVAAPIRHEPAGAPGKGLTRPTLPPADAWAELWHARSARDAALRALAESQHRAAMASHDLRQPVHALVLLAEGIATRVRDPGVQSAVAQLRRVASSMKSLCDALLVESRPGRPARHIRLDANDLRELLADVLATVEEPARWRGLQVRARVGLARSPVLAHADPVLLRQALVKLVHNAVRYTRRGGVLVALRRRGDCLRFEVHDTGVGIAGDDLPRLFEPYQRGPQGTALDDDDGHGLGLAIASRCARLLGATVGARSVPGRGSCFWLSLPAHPGSRGPCPQGQTAKSPRA